MNIRFPKPLTIGDTIAITAPSSGVPVALHSRLNLAINQLKKRGYNVIEGQNVRNQYKNRSADKHIRAKELMYFLTSNEINAVMPPWGGNLAMELLDIIDFDLLKNCDPKWIVGFSDLSTLHFPLTTISGWATLHSPNLMELGASSLDDTTAAIWNVLECDRGRLVEQFSSKLFQNESSEWGEIHDLGLNLTEETIWKRFDGAQFPITFRGHLIGGCLDTISRLAGTKFAQLEKFYIEYKNDGIILYFENVEMNPCELTRALLSLRMHGWFDHLTGMLIGRSAAKEIDDRNQLSYKDALNSALENLPFPIIYDVDIGHVPPQFSLVNGAIATVNFTGKGGSIIQNL